VLFVGRLVPYKGCDMLLEAARELVQRDEVHVEIIGDGPERESLERYVEENGLGRGVTFAGWVEHARLQDRLGRAHVFGFPSVREFGGAVVLEAMGLGVTPIVLDYGGPGELVAEGAGVAVEMGRREQIVERFRRELERFVAEPRLAREMGERARRRVMSSFTWDAKAAQVVEVYEWVLGRRAKPDFGMPLPACAGQPDEPALEYSHGHA